MAYTIFFIYNILNAENYSYTVDNTHVLIPEAENVLNESTWNTCLKHHLHIYSWYSLRY